MISTAQVVVRVSHELVPNVVCQVYFELYDDLGAVAEVRIIIPFHLQTIHVTIREVERVVADDALLCEYGARERASLRPVRWLRQRIRQIVLQCGRLGHKALLLLVLEPRGVLRPRLVQPGEVGGLLSRARLIRVDNRRERLRLRGLLHLRHGEDVAEFAAGLLVSPIVPRRANLGELLLLEVNTVTLVLDALSVQQAHSEHLIEFIEEAAQALRVQLDRGIGVRRCIEAVGDVLVACVEYLGQAYRIVDPLLAAPEAVLHGHVHLGRQLSEQFELLADDWQGETTSRHLLYQLPLQQDGFLRDEVSRVQIHRFIDQRDDLAGDL